LVTSILSAKASDNRDDAEAKKANGFDNVKRIFRDSLLLILDGLAKVVGVDMMGLWDVCC
jgi:hypothetical protein